MHPNEQNPHNSEELISEQKFDQQTQEGFRKIYLQLSMFICLLKHAQQNDLIGYCRIKTEIEVMQGIDDISKTTLKAKASIILSQINEILPQDGLPVTKGRHRMDRNTYKNHLISEHYILLSLLCFVVEENMSPKCYKDLRKIADSTDRRTLVSNSDVIFDLSIKPFITKVEGHLNGY